jgi:glutamate-ammonia-ligase adenylyltransferase
VQAASRLLSDTPLDLAALGEGATAFVLHETETDSATALAAEMAARCGAAAQVIAQRLATSTGDNNGKSLDATE